MFGNLCRSRRGAAAVEYAMLLLLGVIGALGAASAMGISISDIFNQGQRSLAEEHQTTPSGPNEGDAFAVLPDGSTVSPVPNGESCVNDTSGDDSFGTGRGDINPSERCFILGAGGQDRVFYPDASDAFQITIDYPGGAGGEIALGNGNDRVLYRGGNIQIAAGNGNDDVIILEGFDAQSLAANGMITISSRKDVQIDNGTDSILIENVYRDDDGTVSPFDRIAFDDLVFDVEGFRSFVFDTLTTDGDDLIEATDIDDVIRPGAGDDTINGKAGDDLIIYESGNDTIGGGMNGPGTDTLDLTKYDFLEVSFSTGGSNNYDILITTPDGVITLPFGTLMGDTNRGVDIIEFEDPGDTMTHADIMAAAGA